MPSHCRRVAPQGLLAAPGEAPCLACVVRQDEVAHPQKCPAPGWLAGSGGWLVGVRPEDASCDLAKMVFTDPSRNTDQGV
jgi:hypothetical protein